MRSPSNLPPTDGGVFAVSVSAVIDAPIDDVWALLLDFPRYPDWNPAGPAVTLVDARGLPLTDQTARAGAHMSVVLATLSSSGIPGRILLVDGGAHRVAWGYAGAAPGWLLASARWQALSVVDDGGGAPRTLYENREVFSGLAAYVFRWLAGATLQRAFETTAVALKRRAEGA